MKNNRGYTMPELLIVIALVGIVTFIAVLKSSYAFVDNTNDLLENCYNTIEKQAILYGENHKKEFNENNEIITTVKELAKENYLPMDENEEVFASIKDLSNTKVKIKKQEDKIIAEIQK